MGLIPWKNKQELPVRREQSEIPETFQQFRSEMDRLFDSFFSEPWGSFGAMQPFASGDWNPSVDVHDDGKQLTVNMEIPGIEPNDIDISLNGSTITVRGEKKEESNSENKGIFRSERRFGSFQRVLQLPVEVNPDSISATCKNGVLTIAAQKTAESAERRIPVESR